MTDEEIEKKAEAYFLAKEFVNEAGLRIRPAVSPIEAYIAGAKENGVVWHDLRKNPKDLPKTPAESDVWKKVLGDDGELWFYDEDHREWNTRGVFDEWYVSGKIKAWCEIPKFGE